MDKKFVYPGALSTLTESCAFTTAADAGFTINTKRILNTSDLPNGGTDPVVVSTTASLDIGTITTMSVRGATTTTVPLKFSKFGKVVTLNIPTIVLIGAATQIHFGLIPETYRPANQQNFGVAGTNNSVNSDVLLVALTTGDIFVQLYSSAAFTVACGIKETTVSWITA